MSRVRVLHPAATVRGRLILSAIAAALLAMLFSLLPATGAVDNAGHIKGTQVQVAAPVEAAAPAPAAMPVKAWPGTPYKYGWQKICNSDWSAGSNDFPIILYRTNDGTWAGRILDDGVDYLYKGECSMVWDKDYKARVKVTSYGAYRMAKFELPYGDCHNAPNDNSNPESTWDDATPRAVYYKMYNYGNDGAGSLCYN